MLSTILLLLVVVACAAEGIATDGKSSNGPDKKRGLFDEAYPGSQRQMLIKTHFAQESQTYGKPVVEAGREGGYGYAFLSAYPVAHIPLAKYPAPAVQQRYIVLRKMPVEALPIGLTYPQETAIYPQQQTIYPQQQTIYPQQQSIYPQQQTIYPQQQTIYSSLPYQVKMPYAGERYPYSYEQPVRYLLPKRYPLVSTEDGLDYERPPINERSAYRLTPAVRKPVVEEEPPPPPPQIYMPAKQYYIQASTKEIYQDPKPVAYAYTLPAAEQQIRVQKPIFLPVVEKNIQ